MVRIRLRRVGLKKQPNSYEDLQAVAAIGQAELIRFYQHYFDQYNQIVAQVLLTGDIMENSTRVKNTQNTFDTLLEMNIIPIVNENDAVSLSDIELDDNYALALQVAKITRADIILIKMDIDNKFIIQPRANAKAKLVSGDTQLFEELEKTCAEIDRIDSTESLFPESIKDIILN